MSPPENVIGASMDDPVGLAERRDMKLASPKPAANVAIRIKAYVSRRYIVFAGVRLVFAIAPTRMPPLQGSDHLWTRFPGLTPGAITCHRFAAGGAAETNGSVDRTARKLSALCAYLLALTSLLRAHFSLP